MRIVHIKNSTWIGIATNFSIEESCYEQLIKLNELVVEKYDGRAKFSPLWEPHLNYYDLDVPKRYLDDIKDILQDIAKNQTPFNIKTDGIKHFSHGIVYLSVIKNKALDQLETSIVKKISRLKGACRCHDYWNRARTKEYSNEQRINRDLYGNPFVMSTFTPHITLSYLDNDQPKMNKIYEDIDLIDLIPKEITIKHIDLSAPDVDEKIKTIFKFSNILNQ